MTTLHLQVPEFVLEKMREFATRENRSLDEYAASTLAEKVEALAQWERIQQRAARGSSEKFRAALAKVPNVPPVPPDEPAP